MQLLETGYVERRDRRLRWITLGTLMLMTQVVAIVVSLEEHFFDPWLFAMLAAPAVGVAAGVLARQLLESAMGAVKAPGPGAGLHDKALALAPGRMQDRVRAGGSPD
jgi:hypothetical protein